MKSDWSGEIEILGDVQTQGSKKAFSNKKTGRPIMVEANPKLKSWRSEVQAAMSQVAPETPLTGAVGVTMTIYVQRPLAHYGTGGKATTLKPSAPTLPATGKDCDKVARAIGDAGSGVWWRDDRGIAEWHVKRLYAEDGRTRITISAREME